MFLEHNDRRPSNSADHVERGHDHRPPDDRGHVPAIRHRLHQVRVWRGLVLRAASPPPPYEPRTAPQPAPPLIATPTEPRQRHLKC